MSYGSRKAVPEERQDEHWARACRDLQMEEKSGTDNTANRAKAGIDDASSSVKDVANKYGQKADEAVQYASQTYPDAKDVAQQHIGDLERQIRDKPVQAALIALGVGFVVGTLLTRTRRSNPHVWNSSKAFGRRRSRPAHSRLRQEFDNQISRVERGWDGVHGSDYVRDAGRFLGSHLPDPGSYRLGRDHGWNPSFSGILDRVYRLWNYTPEITKR